MEGRVGVWIGGRDEFERGEVDGVACVYGFIRQPYFIRPPAILSSLSPRRGHARAQARMRNTHRVILCNKDSGSAQFVAYEVDHRLALLPTPCCGRPYGYANEGQDFGLCVYCVSEGGESEDGRIFVVCVCGGMELLWGRKGRGLTGRGRGVFGMCFSVFEYAVRDECEGE